MQSDDPEAGRQPARAGHPDGDRSTDPASPFASAATHIDPTFSEHSRSFRAGRRAYDAVKAALASVQSGKRIGVDVDLEQFFDRVNHVILIDRSGKRIDDAGVIRLVRAYVNAGIMDGGVVVDRYLGMPQGGPLSPLLAIAYFDPLGVPRRS
jgi:RNA-directed DNA polymerase